MYKNLLIFLCNVTFTLSVLSASDTQLNQEDTLKHNFFKLRTIGQPVILHAALEGPNAIVGGLGTVMRDLGNKIRGTLPNTFIINPYYEFFKTSPVASEQHKSLGFFKHFIFDRLVTTEVFFNKLTHQLFFSPSSSIISCCEVVKSKDDIYEPTQNFLRIIYFNSSIAKFSDMVNADIVQLHAWHTSLSAALIKKSIIQIDR